MQNYTKSEKRKCMRISTIIIAITSENSFARQRTLGDRVLIRFKFSRFFLFHKNSLSLSLSDCGLFNPSDGYWHLISSLVYSFFFPCLYYSFFFYFLDCARARNIYHGRVCICMKNGKHCILRRIEQKMQQII